MNDSNVCSEYIVPAEEFLRSLASYEACRKKQNILPAEPIQMIGAWSNQNSDGEHEWGYELVLFRVGKKLYGSIENFAGLVGDGGQKANLEEVTIDASGAHIEFNYFKQRFKADILSDNMHIQFEKLEKLKKENVKKNEADIWRRYQSLAATCATEGITSDSL